METNAAASIERAEELRQAGDEPGALAAYRQAASLAAQVFDPGIEAQAMLGVGQMLLLREDIAGARQAFDDAIGRAVEGAVPETEVEAWFGLATACFDLGASKDGHDALLEAMALARQLADAEPDNRERKRRLARAVRLYGEHLGVLGTETDARQALEIARLMFEDLGDVEVAQGIQEEMEQLGDWAR